MHRPRPGQVGAEFAREKREAYRRQQVAAGVRSGREPLRVQVPDGCRVASLVEVAQLVVVSEARVGQGRLRQHRPHRGRLRGQARAGVNIVCDLCLEPHAQIAGRGSVRVRRAPFCCGDVAVGAVLGGRTLPLPRLVAAAPEQDEEVRGDPDANLRQPQKDLAAVVDGDCRRRRAACTDPGRQRGAEAQPHALAVVVGVPGRRDRDPLDGLVANAVFDSLAVVVETFLFSTERHGLRHTRVVGRAGPAQAGRRDRDGDLAPGVVAQVHTERLRPALVHAVCVHADCGTGEPNRDLVETFIFALGAGRQPGEEDHRQDGDQQSCARPRAPGDLRHVCQEGQQSIQFVCSPRISRCSPYGANGWRSRRGASDRRRGSA